MPERDTYLMDPAKMTDEEIDRWIENFRAQPPTLDNFREHSWAGRVATEFQRRMEERADRTARMNALHTGTYQGGGVN